MAGAMTKSEIVDVLNEIATLLEVKGENTFKVRAYQNGARALESLEEPLETVIAEERLGEIDGVGKALVEKITALFETGELEYFDKLKASVPPGLLEMLDIPNFGPKKIKKVYEELGIETIEQLTAACEAGQVRSLSGFGAKSEEKILQGIRNREAYAQRHLWWDVREAAQPILEGLRELPGVIRAEIAGSFRRGRETVGDLDFIVASAEPDPIMDWFVKRPEVVEVSARGSTKSSVRLGGGLQADLRIVPEEQFVFALHHFTGSKEHNVKMRQRALERGWSLSEWGLFDKSEDTEEAGAHVAGGAGRTLAVKGIDSEEALFRALDLSFITPELREGREEIEEAEEGLLPRLIEMGDLRGVFHNHTNASDGSATLEEMAQAAADMGWEYLGIADHSKSSFQANGMSEERLLRQVEKIRALNASGECPVHLFAGCEVDVLRDGSLDFEDEILEQLDYVVLSVHAAMTGMSEAEMTDRIVSAISRPLKVARMLGHLTGRLLLRREAYAVNTQRVIEVAAKEGVIIELNANPRRLDMDWRWWRRAAEAGVLCAINPDAHAPDQFRFTEAGVLAARKGWLDQSQVLNTRNLQEVKLMFNLL